MKIGNIVNIIEGVEYETMSHLVGPDRNALTQILLEKDILRHLQVEGIWGILEVVPTKFKNG